MFGHFLCNIMPCHFYRFDVIIQYGHAYKLDRVEIVILVCTACSIISCGLFFYWIEIIHTTDVCVLLISKIAQ